MSTSQLYPVLDFSSIDYTKIQENAFLIGLDLKNNKLLSKVDNTGTVVVIEKDVTNGRDGRDGVDGRDGLDGLPGKSAYDIWIELGNSGSEAHFLDELRGLPGAKGDIGASAYEVWLGQNNSGTEEDFLNSLKGESGIDGTDGEDGQSAYEIWLANGNTGSEQDFLNSLKGADGQTGLTGQSAYQTWLSQGNTGTEEIFLRSLVGAGATFVDREQPIGQVDGVNKQFELSNLPVENSEYLYVNGLLQESGTDYDYTISGKLITFNTAPIPGMRIRCSYRGITGLNFIDKELPIGEINGINKQFELANPVIRRSEHIYLNGLLQEEGSDCDYIIEGKTIIFNDAPLQNMKIICSYRTA